MNDVKELKFNEPSFLDRMKSILSLDFYRLFHTPMFYIFLAIAAIIPAMVVSMTGSEGGGLMYSSVWQIVASNQTSYTFSNIGEYANMNMVFIFGAIMISIFIGHDYRSGYVKQIFTTHSKKEDYIISKSIIGAFSMMAMCITYLIGGLVGGALVGLSFEGSASSIIIAILGKMIMSIGWGSFYAFINVILRKKFALSIGLSFFFGTGILIILFGMLVGNNPILNIFLYGSSVNANLSSNILSLLICLVVSLSWAVIYNLLGTFLLKKSDVY